MDFLEILVDDDFIKNELDYVEIEKKEIFKIDEFDRNFIIYYGYYMIIYISMVLILFYCMCYSISGVQLSDLLIMISFYCLNFYLGFKSMYIFKRFFIDF